MPQDKPLATGVTEDPPIMQVREEPRWPFEKPHWPFAPTAELSQEQVIAGILKEPGQERLSIRQAMQRGLLTHGTSLALLEHQAASGYIVDLANHRMLSVRDAKNAGLVEREHFNTLLIAEKAVTGYTDPFSGNKISLFQAMKKGLLIKDHGIRLLEAQVATGGLIHPMHSHRLPVEVAHKWGYLDAEIASRISDPAHHTKRCFDPNAHENLTYLQLLPRCVPDPDTGLLMFQVVDEVSVHLDESLRQCLKSATTEVQTGLFADQEVSAWDLLFSRYVPHHKRQELLRRYKGDSLTAQDIIRILTILVTETGCEEMPIHEMPLQERGGSKGASERELKSRMVQKLAGEFRGQKKASVWDVLHSKYVPKGKRKELLKLYRDGILTVDQMETVVTTIVIKTEEEKDKGLGRGTSWDPEEVEEEGDKTEEESWWRPSLRHIHVPVRAGRLKGQDMPVSDLLFSKRFPQGKRQELLELYRGGVISPKQMAAAVSGAWEKVEAGRRRFILRVKRRSPVILGPKVAEGVAASPPNSGSDEVLKAHTVPLPGSELQGQPLSVWDLLFSPYIARDKGEELLRKYRQGRYTAQELASMLAILASLHNLFSSLEQTPEARDCRHPLAHGKPAPLAVSPEGSQKEGVDDDFDEKDDDDDDDDNEDDGSDDDDDDDDDDEKKDEVLKTRMVEVPISKYRGRKVSVWELLHSKCFPKKKCEEVLNLYRIGILTADQVETVVKAIVTKLGGEARAKPGERVKERSRKATPEAEPLAFDFPVGEFQGRRVCMWDLLFSLYIPEAKRQELLAKYMTGALSGQEMVTTLTALVAEAHKERSSPNISSLFSFLYPETSGVMFGLPGSSSSSMHDLLFGSLEQDGLQQGRVMVSEVMVTTTVLQNPEQKLV